MLTMTDNQQIARDRVNERIRTAEQYAKLHPRQRRGRRVPSPRHRIATTLHRLADRVEPARLPVAQH